MENTSGCYKLDGELLYGHSFVLNAKYELHRYEHEAYHHLVDGWYWFDPKEGAHKFFNLLYKI